MPIDIDEFETSPSAELREEGQSVRESIVEFLAYSPEQAYSRKEIQASLNLDAISLLHELSVLEGEGILRHKGHYWAISEEFDVEDVDVDVGERL